MAAEKQQAGLSHLITMLADGDSRELPIDSREFTHLFCVGVGREQDLFPDLANELTSRLQRGYGYPSELARSKALKKLAFETMMADYGCCDGIGLGIKTFHDGLESPRDFLKISQAYGQAMRLLAKYVRKDPGPAVYAVVFKE